MHKFDLDDSPLLESFKDLQRGENVYSRKHGLGYVYSLYNDEVVVQFSILRKRFSVDDKEIRKIPDKYLERLKTKVEINIRGKKMNYTEYKKRHRLTRSQIREEKQKYITINEALDILNVIKNTLFEAIVMNGIKTRKFDRSPMIHRDDLIKLSKIL